MTGDEYNEAFRDGYEASDKWKRPSAVPSTALVGRLRHENRLLRGALRKMLREAESDLRNNPSNPYYAVVKYCEGVLHSEFADTPNERSHGSDDLRKM